jgi:hypothetical protein
MLLLFLGRVRKALGVGKLAHRSTVYGQRPGDGALRDALPVQPHNFEVASATLLAPRPLLALISEGEHRLRTFSQQMTD